MHNSMPFTLQMVLTGRVQGVGFRPFVYRLALELGITGQVRNTPQGVEILVQGPEDTVKTFCRRLEHELPPAAAIAEMESMWLKSFVAFEDFSITASTSGQGHTVHISPDLAICPDCLGEMHDPGDRRFMYPFTNCTNCGPRYTITAAVPYDRATTSMACFPMCEQCAKEYDHPANRRFHAQPNACPTCGPQVWTASPEGSTLKVQDAALDQAVDALIQGGILAVKGLGGFHLACLAFDNRAIKRLRQRKNRPGKPLAVMVANLQTAASLARLSPEERAWLSGRIRPIVLVPKKDNLPWPQELAPDTDRIGLMLPYTPLHEVLFCKLSSRLPQDMPTALVMTSGNAGSEPIALGNREALQRLSPIADLYVLHNRDILIRCDDSVLRIQDHREAPLILRRARGMTPTPIPLSTKGANVLAMGPELKATVCLTTDNQAFVSQHIGDVHNLAVYEFYQESIRHLQNILQTTPQALITDLHPDFLSTRYAAEQDKLPVFALQHHAAHIFAVLAENACQEPVLGLALDGTGLGSDHTLWGGELLYVHPLSLEHRRLGHFSPAFLPGGDQAVAEPWRTAQAYLHTLGIAKPTKRQWPWLAHYTPASDMVAQMLDKGVNCPVTTSCGRLFDAVSALLGLCQRIDYEGQAAVRLEHVQEDDDEAYDCPLTSGRDLAELDTAHLFWQVHADWLSGIPAGRISRRFHLGLVQGLAKWAAAWSAHTGLRRIAISGGVMQNATLAARLPPLLEKHGLIPLTHRYLPPNDACISLGQAAYGRLCKEID